MYGYLYEYLVLNKQLALPGLGTLLLERKPAFTEFAHKQITPASYTISLQQENAVPSKKLFNWLSDKLKIPYHEAIVKINGFAYDLKKQALSGNKVVWEEVGTFSKGISGEIKFEPVLQDHSFDKPVSAVRVIREKAVHTVKVGEDEKTSEEMAELLNPGDNRAKRWWLPALVVGIMLLIIVAIYFLQKGFNGSAAGNQQKLSPERASQ